MASTSQRPDAVSLASTLVVAALVAAAGYATWRETPAAAARWEPMVGTPGAATTSRADLTRSASALRARLTAEPAEPAASVALAAVLIRQARVDSDPALTREAEAVVSEALGRYPADYQTRRMLATVLLSQHRFREAVDVATRSRDLQPDDAWNYGVLGDAHLELGEYEAARAAYDTMMRIRPGAQAYARMAQALELAGDLEGALDTMRMAAEATSAHDSESLAWHYAQLGHLYFVMGRLDDADREYCRAAFTFPDHPYARAGRAQVAAADGRYTEALGLAQPLFEETGSPEMAALIGDLHAALGDAAQATHFYDEAERLERAGWAWEQPQPAALARLLADRALRPDVAGELAERAIAERGDILTKDALAWAYYRAGRLGEAAAAAARALRTGTQDRRILYHAGAIRLALGDEANARMLLDRALDGHPTFDLVNAPAARALRDALEGQAD
jgi:tetratricopeptide (TPR) repeat protein